MMMNMFAMLNFQIKIDDQKIIIKNNNLEDLKHICRFLKSSDLKQKKYEQNMMEEKENSKKWLKKIFV